MTKYWKAISKGVPARSIAFGVQPSAVAAGAAISPSVTVLIRDAEGNTITTGPAATRRVTVALTTPGGATLGGTTTQRAVAGVATFDDLEIDVAGTYTLTATVLAEGFTAESDEFDTYYQARSEFRVGGMYTLDGNGDITVSDIPIGSPSPYRLVVAYVGMYNLSGSGGKPTASVTGVGAMTRAAYIAWTNHRSAIFTLAVPTGTTCEVVVDHNSSDAGENGSVAVFTVDDCDVSGLHDFDGDSGNMASTPPVEVEIPQYGCLVGGAAGWGATDYSATVCTKVFEENDPLTSYKHTAVHVPAWTDPTETVEIQERANYGSRVYASFAPRA